MLLSLCSSLPSLFSTLKLVSASDSFPASKRLYLLSSNHAFTEFGPWLTVFLQKLFKEPLKNVPPKMATSTITLTSSDGVEISVGKWSIQSAVCHAPWTNCFSPSRTRCCGAFHPHQEHARRLGRVGRSYPHSQRASSISFVDGCGNTDFYGVGQRGSPA